MNGIEQATQGIEAGRHLLTWLVTRVDILYIAYRCLDIVNSAHAPLERTSEILESLLPESTPEKEDNDQNVVEVREDRVFRPMQSLGKFTNISFTRGHLYSTIHLYVLHSTFHLFCVPLLRNRFTYILFENSRPWE